MKFCGNCFFLSTSRVLSTSRLTLATILMLVLAGCFGGGPSLAPDYYLLTAHTAQTRMPTQAPTSQPISIGVGPVRVAPFLARPQIVTHNAGGNLHFAPDQRWGEPLEEGVQRVLLHNIAALSGAQTRRFPWRQTTVPDYAVRIDINDLDKLADGTAILDVSWVLEDLKNARVLHTRQQRIVTTVNGSDTAALAAAYSDLLAQLARHVTEATH